MGKIKGGYYIKARCIQNSEIAIMPPYVREIWDWLLKEANHSEKKINGSVIGRGQLTRTFRDIQEGLKWMVGYRKMTYKKWQCENSMRFLRKQGMVTTMKTTRGMLITICNYSLYQSPKNYESNTKADTRTTVSKQLTDTINKNVNNVKNDNNVKRDIYTHWNKQKIICHKKNTYQSQIRIALNKYSGEEILTAITNYGIIVNNKEYYFNYKWTLGDFLKKGIDKFIDLGIAKNNYKKGDQNGKNLSNNQNESDKDRQQRYKQYKDLEEEHKV